MKWKFGSVLSFSCWFLSSLGEASCKSNHNDQRKKKKTHNQWKNSTNRRVKKKIVGVLIAIVELYDSAITDKPELVTMLVPKSSISRKRLWHDDWPLIYISGIVLKTHKQSTENIKVSFRNLSTITKTKPSICLYIYKHQNRESAMRKTFLSI